VAVAAPAEARAVLSGVQCDWRLADLQWQLAELASGLDLVVTGVGKSNAAGAVARVLDPTRHRWVLSAGVCGSLPRLDGAPPLGLRRAVASTDCRFADEGLRSDEGFLSLAEMGFPPAPGLTGSIPVDMDLRWRLSQIADESAPIATVSTCSGTDDLAMQVVGRTGAAAEAMEGAAVGLVAHRLGVGFAELRVVSNTTGSRTRQVWDLAGALARLSDLASMLPGALAMRAGEDGEG